MRAKKTGARALGKLKAPKGEREAEDSWVRCVAANGNLRATSIRANRLVAEARERHRLDPVGTVALGEALVASLLLSSGCKAGERASLSVRSETGSFRQVFADSDPLGFARGFLVTRKGASKPGKARGPWGDGLLTVARVKEGLKEPYTGAVPLVTGHLSKDLAFYLSQSEQIPSAVGIRVDAGKTGQAIRAGGFLVQLMPGAGRAEIEQVEQNIRELGSLRKLAGEPPVELLASVLADFSFVILEERTLRFHCACTRERVLGALRLLGKAELEDMMAKDGGAEVRCDFCATPYRVGVDELGRLAGG